MPVALKTGAQKSHPNISFVLVDSNGIALLPPNDELEMGDPPKLPAGEKNEDNQGFDFAALHRVSRRDQLVSSVWRNIVPLAQDDDVLILSDLHYYSVISNLPETRWKLSLSVPLSFVRNIK